MHRSFAQVVSSVSPAHDVPATSLPVAFDFAKGLAFPKEVHSKFGHHVNCLPNRARKDFFLVISFGRASFRLDIHTVGTVLQAHFGGTSSLFKVKFLRDRTFRFSVTSSSVGFIFIILGLSLTAIANSLSSYGVMVEQIGKQKKNCSTKKILVLGKWFIGKNQSLTGFRIKKAPLWRLHLYLTV
jgi:hypothetical protein